MTCREAVCQGAFGHPENQVHDEFVGKLLCYVQPVINTEHAHIYFNECSTVMQWDSEDHAIMYHASRVKTGPNAVLPVFHSTAFYVRWLVLGLALPGLSSNAVGEV